MPPRAGGANYDRAEDAASASPSDYGRDHGHDYGDGGEDDDVPLLPLDDEDGGDGGSDDVPLLAACRHLLLRDGRIIGEDVALMILPKFPTLCSAVPPPPSSSSSSTSPRDVDVAIASINGRSPLTRRRASTFVLRKFGPALHHLGYGRGDRMALVLPNGPELALAILATAHWAMCIPLGTNSAPAELESNLRGCRADLVGGPRGGGGII